MPDFSIPLSGLTACQTALSVISNNLANMNTTGYKDTGVSFTDLFYQNIGSTGSGDPEQIGAGATVGSLDTVFSGGDVETTGVSTDVAISGNGFFVLQENGQNQYTRAGNFTVNSAGVLVSSDGSPVLGYAAVNGAIDPTQGLGTLQLGQGQINPPNPTSYIQMNTNLDAGAAVGDSFSSPVTVYDSLGSAHVVTVQFTKTATDNWSYAMTVPGADVGINPGNWSSGQAYSVGDLVLPNPPDGHVYECSTAGTSGASAPAFPTGSGDTVNDGTATWTEDGAYPPVIASGSLTFDSNGNLTSPASNITGLQISGLADGASTLNFSWNLLSNGQPTLTQEASASSTASTSQDGCSSGTLQSFSINTEGVIEGSFTNGTKPLGQIALANFGNEEGLSRDGNANYSATLDSGQPVIGTPGTGGFGTVSGGALEDSNVDISQEFSNLIMAQRGFEANAKAITTFDEITQDTINLKR